jgi:hypothetical protein
MLLGSPMGIGQKNMKKKDEASTQSHGGTKRTPKPTKDSQHGCHNARQGSI